MLKQMLNIKEVSGIKANMATIIGFLPEKLCDLHNYKGEEAQDINSFKADMNAFQDKMKMYLRKNDLKELSLAIEVVSKLMDPVNEDLSKMHRILKDYLRRV